MKRRIWLALPVMMAILAVARADADAERWSVDDLSFISGAWEGPLFGGHAEETWLPPRHDTMVGVFRLTWTGSERRVYELFLIEQTPSGEIEMSFRHFSPGMELWENEVEKPNRFLLTTVEPRRARFDAPDSSQNPARFVFASSEDGSTLTIDVTSLDENGEVSESFQTVYTRAN